MRSKLFIPWAVFRWVLLTFLVASALEAPAPAITPPPPVEKLPAMRPIRIWFGMASWYGAQFHGRDTASGEPFDMNAPTAAHVSLPLGSLVRLTNPSNGRTRMVRITDRGPYVRGREMDVSFEVARSLGFNERGVTRLRIELVEVPNRIGLRSQSTADRRPGL